MGLAGRLASHREGWPRWSWANWPSRKASPQVKQFAQRMVTNQELMQLAKTQNLDLPTQVDAKHKADMDRLRGVNRTAFDAAYMQHMVQDHQKDVAEFQKEAQSASSRWLSRQHPKDSRCNGDRARR
jgi:predicted outer membrane protein